MKVVILAGGLGTRIAEYTKKIPKPMIQIRNKPLIVYIMEHYSRYGFNDFYIALGYKGNLIRKYFKENNFNNWNIKLVDTGSHSMTGGRLKRLEKYLKNESFFLTYGDGLSNVNIKNLLKFHVKHEKIATISAVRPPARFGFIKLSGNKVRYFREKSSLDQGWINGGFMVFNSKIFNYLKDDLTFLEKDPMEKLSKKNMLYAYKHKGFWQCMDTIRDKEILERCIKEKKHLEKK